MMIKDQEYNDWIKLREESRDESGDSLCYCGHTNKCSCGDPDMTLFQEGVKNGTIILNNLNNGWREVNNLAH